MSKPDKQRIQSMTKKEVVKYICDDLKFGYHHKPKVYREKAKQLGREISGSDVVKSIGPFAYRVHQDQTNLLKAGQHFLHLCHDSPEFAQSIIHRASLCVL